MSCIGVVSRSLFPKQELKSEDISVRRFVHWSGACEPSTLIFLEILFSWDVIARPFLYLLIVLAMRKLFSGSWNFHLLRDMAEQYPLSPPIDVTTKQSI